MQAHLLVLPSRPQVVPDGQFLVSQKRVQLIARSALTVPAGAGAASHRAAAKGAGAAAQAGVAAFAGGWAGSAGSAAARERRTRAARRMDRFTGTPFSRRGLRGAARSTILDRDLPLYKYALSAEPGHAALARARGHTC